MSHKYCTKTYHLIIVQFTTIFSIGNQLWSYDPNSKQIRHGSSEKCLAIIQTKDKVIMEECNSTKESQKWRLENYDPSKL